MKAGAVFLPFSHGEWVSLCAGLPSPEGRVLGAWSPGVHSEPGVTGAPPGAAGVGRCRGETGAWAPRSPQEALGGSCRRLHYLPGIARVHRSLDEAEGGCTWCSLALGKVFQCADNFQIDISTGRRVDVTS